MSEEVDDRIAGLVDPVRLGQWLNDQGHPGDGEPFVRHLSGGASNEIFEIIHGGRRMALRRPPRNVPKGRNDTMLREFRILNALNGTDVPHPEAVAVCDDETVIGSAFYMMDFVDGWTAMGLPEWPEPFEDDVQARAGLAYALVDGIAKLGRVDWQAQGLTGLGKPEGFHERQVDRWMSQFAGYKFRELPGLDQAAQFLRSYTPRSYTPGIMHGDYQFANVMFHHGGPARLAAVVDFEMGTIGDPLLDLAWILMGWPNADEDRSVTSYVDYSGMPDREDLLQFYATHSGRPVDEIDYYLVLANFKMAVVLEGGYARVAKGESDNPKMAFFGDVALGSALKAGELAQRTPLRNS
jgi:aminoglycoside phosphotransferase (APT) family kinase protein